MSLAWRNSKFHGGGGVDLRNLLARSGGCSTSDIIKIQMGLVVLACVLLVVTRSHDRAQLPAGQWWGFGMAAERDDSKINGELSTAIGSPVDPPLLTAARPWDGITQRSAPPCQYFSAPILFVANFLVNIGKAGGRICSFRNSSCWAFG